jgi:two-component system, chemotaxis family, response regulator Rcp1
MANVNSGDPIEILLVEDNPADVRLTQEGFRECKINNNLHAVENGVEAMDYLRRQGAYAGAVEPDIILLDLNLPLKDGREVLAEVKADDHLKRIPVVVLTSSKAEEDIVKTYDLHANCYVSKPLDLDQFYKVVQAVENFWFTIVKLPTRTNGDAE